MTTPPGMVRIAVDAMGGDHGPAEIIKGAALAAKQGGVAVLLVGDPDKVQPELPKYGKLPIMPVPSEGMIVEGEHPALALRQKPKASILVATGAVKKGMADACVTMGSTGGAMAAAAVVLGMFEGIERPALGGPVIGFANKQVIIDLGTNVDCKPQQLLSFAVIGNVFARTFWGVEKPRIALLTVGSESGKGNKQVKETAELFQKSGLNFTGNVEGNDLPFGRADVVVCDGFVGNIVMKLTEGLGEATSHLLKERLKGKMAEADAEAIAKEVFDLHNVVEVNGGGPLLGVNGVSVVGHGRGRADAVARAIGMAKKAVDVGFVAKLNTELAQVRANVGV
ncbi:MAG: phosphate acyltransferase PlsX [SAR202 cluster bacterium]|nr:phosphate acyltransferase PlsX [SAR202 cluster bacterium]